MNSQEEKELFESYGWTYDSIKRIWESPTGVFITTDQLMEYTTNPAGELELKELIRMHGVKK